MTTITEFRPGLWLADLTLEEFDVRAALIIGEQRAVVWDTLSHPRDMAPLLPLIGEKELVIVYSHADWDHVWGTGALPPGSLIIGHETCLARFSNDVPVTLREKEAAKPEQWAGVTLIAPHLTFRQTLSLDLGGVTLTLHYLPGHTPDCLVAFLPEWGILLAGDTVETPLPIVYEDSPFEAWIAQLERWEGDSRVETVIPSHGMIGGRDLIRRNIDYLQALLKGGAISLPENPPDFYVATHQTNVKRVQAYLAQRL